MPATLKEILFATQKAVAARREATDRAELDFRAEKHVPRGFRRALERAAEKGGWAVIAELKKASPSKGVLRGNFPVARLAVELEQAGAAALSVVTEEKFFEGSLGNLSEASTASQLPCLRKDFILEEYQLLEARAYGADAVLLIASVLPVGKLTALTAKSHEMGLEVLCEVRDHRELQVATAAGCDMIGVNNRDLQTFQVDMGTALRLGPAIRGPALRVAESGIQSPADLHKLRAAGYHAFLIAEFLMRAESPGEALKKLLAGAKTHTD
ncbi:MAG: indole-3-glycerol phosphate synthase TrpC [Acidobacteriota bacterium]|nr:indole-3-glycerol phosphate synthase TrpC [Acidobacteriota bacterium]